MLAASFMYSFSWVSTHNAPLLWPDMLISPNTVTSPVHYCCQEIQATREGQARQHTGHSSMR